VNVQLFYFLPRGGGYDEKPSDRLGVIRLGAGPRWLTIIFSDAGCLIGDGKHLERSLAVGGLSSGTVKQSGQIDR
jgi:hypothetical protein